MRLTTKGRYAVTALLDIALHHEGGPVNVLEIAQRQDISAAYLEQLFGKLKRAGLLHASRGPGGGYLIARDLPDINVADIVQAVGEGVDATRCHGSADCQDGVMCLTHDLWAELSNQIDDFLRHITLADLVSRQDVKNVASRQDLQLIHPAPH